MAVTMTATKALFAGGISTVLAFLGALSVALGDGTVSTNEWVVIAIATVTALGGTGVGTYLAPANRPKGVELENPVDL